MPGFHFLFMPECVNFLLLQQVDTNKIAPNIGLSHSSAGQEFGKDLSRIKLTCPNSVFLSGGSRESLVSIHLGY